MSLAADPRRRIDPIKAYREQTGADLKAAMQVVDWIARQRPFRVGELGGESMRTTNGSPSACRPTGS
jgi:hypothetical protein